MATTPYWISRTTQEELLLFLIAWEQLSREERLAYLWGTVQYHSSGWVGQQLGYDITDRVICICGNDPVYDTRSAQAQIVLDSIHQKWDTLFRGSKLVAGTGEPYALVRKVTDIPFAFHDLIRVMLGFDREDMIHNFREERVKQQKQAMVDLATDIAHFLPRARTWIGENPTLFARELNPTAPS